MTLLILVFGLLVGTGVRATEFFATCTGECGCCIELRFTDCDSCSIDEPECTWEYSGCAGVVINCPPCG
jgi:hypothetical protein